MAHPWESLVLGGVDTPRILVLKNNDCPNPFFTKNLDDWTMVAGISGDELFERVDSVNAYGQYMAKLSYTNNTVHITFTHDYETSIEDKIFLLSFDAKSLSNFTVEFNGDTEFVTHNFSASAEMKRFFVIGTATGQTSDTVDVRIYGNRPDLSNTDGELFIDNVYFSEIFKDYSFPQPQDSGKLIFNKLKLGENNLITYKQNEFRVRWQPIYIGEYYQLTAEYEEQREQIAKSELLFCIPHIDVDWGFIGRWMPSEFLRSYPFNQYTGHRGIISIQSVEYFKQKPYLKVT